MFSKYEIFGFSISVLLLAVGLYLAQFNSSGAQMASVASSEQDPIVAEETSDMRGVSDALIEATSPSGELRQLVVDDVVIGTGDAVEEGDSVTVHYTGRLQDGTEFDSSYNRGEPFTFTVGQGRVISGWEQGLVGMQVGGQRILVIPPRLAYGADGIGAIPPDATLLFAVELLSID